PFFRSLDLAARGVRLLSPDASFGHPLDGGRVAIAERYIDQTAHTLRGRDGHAWRKLLGPLAAETKDLDGELLGPVVHVPRHPLLLARFGIPALRSAMGLARTCFEGEAARALFVGVSAH